MRYIRDPVSLLKLISKSIYISMCVEAEKRIDYCFPLKWKSTPIFLKQSHPIKRQVWLWAM